ncbi:MAG: fumarylacetoacetate hydrolase family protein [Nitrososphaerota archaeon]|nr:fumarylacetoacetate hydrolase family protein [Nitrososphaerota archaeon]MDG6943087.1 fumarylacetoacetate hydrolase family protein [Nitrososphaerota archaeon]
MKILNYEVGGAMRVGVLVDGQIFRIAHSANVEELIQRGPRELARISTASHPEEMNEVRVRPPILRPDKILLAAVNYKSHGAEQNATRPAEPYFFTKFSSCIIGQGDPILVPRVSKEVDWEAELAVVMGRKCRYASKADSLSYVAGFTVANDVSFRDLQFPQGWPEKTNTLGQNWVKGKALDAAFPLGPWLVTTDEIPDPQGLRLSLRVNGAERQSASTEDMIFSVAELIEYLSSGLTLLPGDIISTGTPAGVAAFTGAPYLKDGDIVETSIDRIGTLTNPVKAE